MSIARSRSEREQRRWSLEGGGWRRGVVEEGYGIWISVFLEFRSERGRMKAERRPEIDFEV